MHNEMKQYFCISGQGWSGSSAIVEYLNDFSDCYVMNKEINICLREFGIFGMYLLIEQNVPTYGVIDRFNTYINYIAPKINSMPHVCKETLGDELLRISKEFLDKISWRNTRNVYTHDLCFIDKIIKACRVVPVFNNRSNSFKDRMKKNFIEWIINNTDLKIECPMLRQPQEIFRLNVQANQYRKAAKQFLHDYASLFTNKNKFVVDNFLDIEYFNNDSFKKLSSFFDDLKVVFVCRDPRDQFVSQSKYSIASDERVDEFIRVSRERSWKNYPHNNTNILDIRFEDFILKHTETSRKILDFLGIKANSKIAKPKYNFELSKKNVGIWKMYPNQKVIEKIAYELKDYIYEI